MRRIIDMECSIPHGLPGEVATTYTDRPPAGTEADRGQPAGYGMANYARIFSSRREGGDHRPAMTLDGFVDMLGKLGIERSVPFGVANEETSQLLRRYPGRFLGLARISINTFKRMTGGRALKRLVGE